LIKFCIQIGIIGGSGLDDPDILDSRLEKKVTTPFGDPSDVLIEGKIGGQECVLLARYIIIIKINIIFITKSRGV